MNINRTRVYYIIGSVSIMLLVLNLLRVYKVSITHDEAYSYFFYITESYTEIISSTYATANNHILNSILSRFSITTFSDNLFFLRLPNVVAHAGYLLASFLLSIHLFRKKLWWSIIIFLLLQLNPFLFEFWGLARGYGLSIAFMLASIYQLLLYIDGNKTGNLLFALLLLSLSVFSNFVLLNYAVGFVCVLFIYWYSIYKQTKILKQVLLLVGSLILLSVLIWQPLESLINRNELYYGGEGGFVVDTVGSLISNTFFTNDINSLITITSWIMVALAVLVVSSHTRKTIKNRKVTTGFVLSLLLLIPALSVIAQHYFLGSKFLINRTTLFFYPLIVLAFVYTLYDVHKKYRVTAKAIVFVIASLVMFNFVSNYNTKSSRSWYYDQHSQWVLQRIVNDNVDEGKIVLYLDWWFTPSMKYNIMQEYPEQFAVLEGYNEVLYNSEEYDYYLVRSWEKDKIPASHILDTVVVADMFYLYKRKQ